MTRKQFEAIAKIINTERALRDEGRMDRIAKRLADLFEDNYQGRFDYGRFLKACGVPDNESIQDKTNTGSTRAAAPGARHALDRD